MKPVRILNLAVIVGALGYFVDLYDLVLFSIVRVPSLHAIGIPDKDVLDVGVFLLNMQMAGLLVGGLLWGIVGDKRGRLSVLLGSVLMYSVSNLGNAFVTSVPMYGFLRLTAGIGLAGELGAAITLVSEIMPKETRGYGTMVVASVGLMGAVAAALTGEYLSWKAAYIVGGGLGLSLLLLRVGLFESGLYEEMRGRDVRAGDLRLLFLSPTRLRQYVQCILLGIPIWFVVGILMTLAPELSLALGTRGEATAGHALLSYYVGHAAADFLSGFLSQYFKSRRRVILQFLCLTVVGVACYLLARGVSLPVFYFICAVCGAAVGYWAVAVTVASEMFGTNLRATVTTTVPNFIRGSVVPISLSFRALRGPLGIVSATSVVGMVVIGLAFYAALNLPETYGKDLSYFEV